MKGAPPDPPGGLAQQKTHTSELLSMLAVLAPEPIPTHFLIDCADRLPASIAELLTDPEHASLRKMEEDNLLVLGGKGLMLPDRVRNELLEDLNAEEQRRWCELTLALLEGGFPEDADDHASWGECELLLPHLRALTDRSASLGIKVESIPRLLERGARYLHSRGEFDAALELATKAMAHVEAVEDDALRGALHRTRGRLLAEHGDLDEARLEIEKALDIHESLGAQHVEVRWDRVSLAGTLAELSEHEEALRQVDLALLDRDRDRADRCDCAAWRMRAWVLWDADRFEEAKSTYEDALALTEEVVGPDHEDTVDALTGIGGVFGFLGEREGSPEMLEKARAELVRALDTLGGSVDDQHPEMAVIRSNLGDVLHSLGELEGARVQLEEALDAGEAFLPRDHRGLWVRHRKLASVLQSLGHLEEARAHAEEALAISERVVEPGDARIEQDLQALAGILRAIPDLPGSRDAYVKARAIAAQGKGEDHPDVARYDLWLGQVLRQLGDVDSSRRYLVRALDVFENAPEDKLRQGLTARLELALLLVESGGRAVDVSTSLGHAERGEALRREIVELFRQTLEAELEDADLSTMTAVAEAAIGAAPDLARSVLEKAAEVLEDEEEQTPALRKKVGIAWQRLGRALRLEKAGEDAVKALEAALPYLDDSPQAQGVLLHDIAAVHSDEGRVEEAIRYYRDAAERKRQAGDKGKRRDLAITLQALGRKLADAGADPAEILKVYEEQLETLRSLPEPDRRLEGIALSDMGDIHRREEDMEEAARFYRRSLDCKRKASGSVSSTEIGYTYIWLGRTLASLGHHEEAIACYREWLELLRSTERDPQAEGVVLHDLAGVRRAQGHDDEAIELLREAAERKREGDNPRDLAFTLQALARSLAASDFEEPLALLDEQMGILTSLDPRDPNFEGIALHDIAALLDGKDELDKAIDVYREAVRRKQEAENVDLESLIATQQALARALERNDQPEPALIAYEEQLKMLTELPQPNPQLEGVALHDIADVWLAKGDADKAIEFYRRAVERKEAAEVVNTVSLSSTHHTMGRVLEEKKEAYPEALIAYRESLRLLRELPERDLRAEAITVRDIGDVRRAQGEIAEAATLFAEAAELAEKAGETAASVTALELLGRMEEERERFSGAADAYRRAAAIVAGEGEEDPRKRASLLISQGTAELSAESGNEKAVEVLEIAVEDLRREPEADKALLYSGLGMLGLAVVDEDPEEAVGIFREARDLLDGVPAADPLERAAIRSLLAYGHALVDEQDEASKAREEAIRIFEEAFADALPPADALAPFSTFCLEKGNFELAAVVRQKVVSAVEEDPARLAEYERPIADMFGALGRAMEVDKQDYPAALEAYNRELETLRKLPEPDLGAESVTLHDIGDVYYAQDLMDEAEDLHEQAIERIREAGKGTPLDRATMLTALSTARFGQGRLAEAARGGSEALGMLGEDERPSDRLHAAMLALSGLAAEEEGDLDRAFELFQRALDLMGDPPDLYRLDPSWVVDRRDEVGRKLGRGPAS